MMVNTHSKMTLVPRPTCGMFEKSLEGSRLQHWNPYYSPSVFQLSAYFQSPSKTNVPSSSSSSFSNSLASCKQLPLECSAQMSSGQLTEYLGLCLERAYLCLRPDLQGNSFRNVGNLCKQEGFSLLLSGSFALWPWHKDLLGGNKYYSFLPRQVEIDEQIILLRGTLNKYSCHICKIPFAAKQTHRGNK